MYVGVLGVYMFVYHVYTCVPTGGQKRTLAPGTGIIESSEPPCGF